MPCIVDQNHPDAIVKIGENAMKIRLNVAAVIIQRDHLLLVEFDDETGLHYNLPGGGVEFGESLHDALQREVREETSAEIASIERLLMIWEYIGSKQGYRYGDSHKVALVFACTLQENSLPTLPANPDPHQTGVRWVALQALPTIALIPDLADQLLTLIRTPEIQAVTITVAD
jgi:8-oxo-dGTP pyrophosphatase MutT (NUDIX family)